LYQFCLITAETYSAQWMMSAYTWTQPIGIKYAATIGKLEHITTELFVVKCAIKKQTKVILFFLTSIFSDYGFVLAGHKKVIIINWIIKHHKVTTSGALVGWGQTCRLHTVNTLYRKSKFSAYEIWRLSESRSLLVTSKGRNITTGFCGLTDIFSISCRKLDR